MDDLKPGNLADFAGTETLHCDLLYPWLIWTDGVDYFAKNAGGGAHWFLDIIGTELKAKAAKEPFMSITLSVGDMKATISATDGDKGDGPVTLFLKKIGLTDCPNGDWKFFLVDNGNDSSTLMLPSEY